MVSLPVTTPPAPRTRRNGFSVREFQTNCVICGLGIFKDDPQDRVRGNLTGRGHQGCIDARKKAMS